MKLSDSPTAKLPDAPTQDRPSSFVATPGEGESTKQPAAKKTTRKKADPAPGSDGRRADDDARTTRTASSRNLYGLHRLGPEGCAEARRLGRHQDLLDKGRDWIVDEMKESGLRGRGGAGFPTGLKWSFMPKQVGRASALSGRQRRRVRAGHLQGSRDHAPRSASADRRCLIASLRDGCACRLHLHPRRISSPSASALQRAIDEAYEAKLIGKNNIHGWPFDIYVAHGAGAYICGEETALLESLEGKKGQPRLKPPFPANVGPLWLPDDGEQRRDRSRSRHDPAPRRRLVRRHRPAEQCRHQAVLHLRPREQALQRRRGDGHHRSAS